VSSKVEGSGSVGLSGLVAARQRKLTSLYPLHAGKNVSEPVDRAPLALYDRL
jgi:hypothetical protein